MLAVPSKDVLYSGGQHVLLKGAVLWGHMAVFIAWRHIIPLNNLDYGGIKCFGVFCPKSLRMSQMTELCGF